MADKAAFQVIVLGPTGGPREDAVTGLLVRSTSKKWAPGSVVAVDAGTLLAGIIRSLEPCISHADGDKPVIKDGPFLGLELPYRTAEANAAHVFREIIAAVLITHPHLDHIAGLAINTPILEAGNGPKTVAALPSVIAALRNNMFNDVIWPNLSDEDGGAGLLTYQRLVDGGNPRFGRGETRGYVRACDGLLAKCLAVSHGRCKQRDLPDPGPHLRFGSTVFGPDSLMLPSRAISVDHTELASVYSPARSPRVVASGPKDPLWSTVESSAFFIHDHASGSEIIVFGDVEPDSLALDPRNKFVWEAAAPKVVSGTLRAIFIECSFADCVDDSSLYGHLCPRHLIAELSVLASKVVAAQQPSQQQQQQQQYRHRHSDSSAGAGKRKREDCSPPRRGSRQVSPRSKRAQSSSLRRIVKPEESPPPPSSSTRVSTGSALRSHFDSAAASAELPELTHDDFTPSYQDTDDTGDAEDHHYERHDQHLGMAMGMPSVNPTAPSDFSWADTGTAPLLPLTGLSVYIIHVKDNLTDGPSPASQILRELRTQGEEARLGCEFYVPVAGEGICI